MYNDLLDHGRERVSQKDKNPGLSGTYVHGVHVMLHNCLNRAVKERLIVRNPADDVIVPKIDKKEMKILPPEQVKAYLKAASVRGVLPLFYLELTSGLRKGEIAALLWSDLDAENCTLSVTKQLVSTRDGELKITQPKTATSVRLISLPQETVELSGAFCSYPHLGHRLGQRHFRGFYVHVSARCKQAINKVDSPACGQAASG